MNRSTTSKNKNKIINLIEMVFVRSASLIFLHLFSTSMPYFANPYDVWKDNLLNNKHKMNQF